MKEILQTVWISEKARINKNVRFGRNIVIYGNTTIGNNTIIEDNVIIGHPSPNEIKTCKKVNNDLYTFYDNCNTSKTFIGNDSIVRSFTTIYSGNIIGNNFDCGHNVIIRENCNIHNNCYLFTNTQIKSNVIIGSSCRLAGTICDRTKIGNFTSMLGHTVHRYLSGVGGEIEPSPTIGDGVIIGREAVIVGDVYIGNFACVSSNSVVTKTIPMLELHAGVPAKFLRRRTKKETEKILKLMEDYKNE